MQVEVPLLFSLCRWRNRGIKYLNNMLKVTQQEVALSLDAGLSASITNGFYHGVIHILFYLTLLTENGERQIK